MTRATPDSAGDPDAHGAARHEGDCSAAPAGAAKIASKRAPFARCCAIVLLTFAATAVAQDGPPFHAPTDADGVQRVTIVGGSYFFKPDRIVAKAGRPLELSVKMEQGVVPHKFVLEGADGKRLADVELAEAPKSVRVELAAGDYAFYCPNRLLMFKSHRERGMSGVLEVRE